MRSRDKDGDTRAQKLYKFVKARGVVTSKEVGIHFRIGTKKAKNRIDDAIEAGWLQRPERRMKELTYWLSPDASMPDDGRGVAVGSMKSLARGWAVTANYLKHVRPR